MAYSIIMKYKWAQLDLARQMESLDFIREFIDIMAQCGYNGILLYLEDRLRTASYPYPADSDCYTVEEMRGIVSYAAERGMEVVPCVATLGHAERFLAHPELEKLSELQGDMKGRFGWSKKQTFCPTHPEFYDFMTTYLKDVAEVFPSAFFHAGLDEFWDYCLCPRCKAAAPDFKSQMELFVKHVRIIDDCLKSCGKRMVMWSDMFEYYPEALAEIPKDIVMVDWQYQGDVRFYLHHLFDCQVEDRLERNKSLGLETFLGPVDMLFRNAESYLNYARNKEFTGCILTSWEKTDTFLYRTIPTFVYAGYLMNGLSPEDAANSMFGQLFGKDAGSALCGAVKLALTNGPWRHFMSIAKPLLFSRNFYGIPQAAFEADYVARDIIRAEKNRVTSALGTRILDDLLAALDEKCISHDLVKYFYAVLDGQIAVDQERFDAMRTRFAKHLDNMTEHWNLWRNGIVNNEYSRERKEKLLAQLDSSHETLASSRFVKVRICLPDGFGIEHVRVSLKLKDDDWQCLGDSVPKPHGLESSLGECFLPFKGEGTPEAIKIEAYGMGGIGICHVEADGHAPCAITSVSGTVENPGNLLGNDVRFAWFGNQSTREAYFNDAVAKTIHTVVLRLS